MSSPEHTGGTTDEEAVEEEEEYVTTDFESESSEDVGMITSDEENEGPIDQNAAEGVGVLAAAEGVFGAEDEIDSDGYEVLPEEDLNAVPTPSYPEIGSDDEADEVAVFFPEDPEMWHPQQHLYVFRRGTWRRRPHALPRVEWEE